MRYSALLLIAFCIMNCQSPSSEPSIDGFWMQEGYGVYLEIKDSTYKMYDVTEISCQPSASASVNNWTDSLHVLLDLYDVASQSDSTLTLKYGITQYSFNRLQAPLSLCQNPIFESQDPLLNFDILWNTFNENYAYSEVRNVDWKMLKEKHNGLINSETSDVELFGFIGEMLDAIGDAHITFQAPDSILNAYLATINPPASQEHSPESSASENETDSAPPVNPRETAMSKITELYKSMSLESYHKDLVKWGMLDNNIGYIQLNGMNGFSKEVTIDESLPHDPYWESHWNEVFGSIAAGMTLGQYLRNEVEGASTVKSNLLSFFSNAEAEDLIIDLRFNPGGTDKVAMELLSGFSDKINDAFTKKFWYNGSNSSGIGVSTPPSSGTFAGEVIILTSSRTGSSAEMFVLSTMKNDKFTRIGSPTMGVFSDVLQKKLPNGWSYSLSNEIYESWDGNNYEYSGIPPHYIIVYPRDWYGFHSSIIDLESHDPAIEKAIEVLSN